VDAKGRITSAGEIAVGGGVESLDDLNDVTLTSPISDDVLTYDAYLGQWVNAQPSAQGLSVVQDEGSALTARDTINFRGILVTASDDSPNTRTNVDIFNPQSMAFYYDDFMDLQATVLGRWNTTSGTLTNRAAEASHPGIFRRLANNQSTWMFTPSVTSSSNGFLLPADTFDLHFFIRVNNDDSNVTYRIGLYGGTNASSSAQPSDGIYFEKLTTDTDWFGVCRAASSQTRSTSPGAVSAAAWARLRIRRIDASTIGFTIDGGTEQTVTTNVPTASMLLCMFMQSHAAADKTYDIDLITCTLSGLAR
jgi:hypothetical protein